MITSGYGPVASPDGETKTCRAVLLLVLSHQMTKGIRVLRWKGQGIGYGAAMHSPKEYDRPYGRTAPTGDNADWIERVAFGPVTALSAVVG